MTAGHFGGGGSGGDEAIVGEDVGKLRQTANGAEEAEGGEEEVPGDQRPLQVEALLPQRHGRLQAEGEEDVGDAEVDRQVPVLVREAHDVVAVLQDVPLPGEDGGECRGRPPSRCSSCSCPWECPPRRSGSACRLAG
ncbi:hypothetical protein TYRP_020956 [Tyrophagus putrescentiae]|nr:hypothetical protein TYRP_020956 [Tyrophagus putrescentiae]